jgi:hypothetical protein
MLARGVGWVALVALGVGAGLLAGRWRALPPRASDSGVCPDVESREAPPTEPAPSPQSVQSAPIPPRRPAAVRSPARAAVSEPLLGRPAQGETGIPLPRVRKGTLLDLLGLETGDQLLRINHLDVRSPEQALRAYALLRRADHLVVEVRRGDRIIELVYRII